MELFLSISSFFSHFPCFTFIILFQQKEKRWEDEDTSCWGEEEMINTRLSIEKKMLLDRIVWIWFNSIYLYLFYLSWLRMIRMMIVLFFPSIHEFNLHLKKMAPLLIVWMDGQSWYTRMSLPSFVVVNIRMMTTWLHDLRRDQILIPLTIDSFLFDFHISSSLIQLFFEIFLQRKHHKNCRR